MAEIVPIKRHALYRRQKRESAAGALRKARANKLTDVLIIGWDEAGDLYVSGSPPDPNQALWLMEACKRRLFGDG